MNPDDASLLARRLHWEAESERGRLEPGADAVVEDDPELTAAWVTPRLDPATPSFERRDIERREEAALERRRQLWRDSATILSAIVVALLVFQLLGGLSAALPGASPSPSSAGPGTESEGIGPSAPGQSHAPIVDPSLGIDATPTIPVRTLPPTGTHAPTLPPAVTPRPTTRPAPTPTRPVPTPTPTPTPTPEPTPTPIPSPTVHVSCDVTAPLTVTCAGTTSDIQNNSEVWTMGDPGTVVLGGDGTGSITFVYDTAGTHHVTLTVTGLDGSSTASDSTDVTV
jgi:hypothetical protein